MTGDKAAGQVLFMQQSRSQIYERVHFYGRAMLIRKSALFYFFAWRAALHSGMECDARRIALHAQMQRDIRRAALNSQMECDARRKALHAEI